MFRRIVIPLLIILALISVYLGAYKPRIKSTTYIETQSRLPTYRTLEQLVDNFDKALEYPSPVGQEEVVKFSLSQFEKMILNQDQSETASVNLVHYIEQYIYEDNIVHLLQTGNLYNTLYERFKKQEYLETTENYYKKIREIAPNIPHSLYRLFTLYKRSGQYDKMKETGQKILELWPEDSKVKNELKTLENE